MPTKCWLSSFRIILFRERKTMKNNFRYLTYISNKSLSIFNIQVAYIVVQKITIFFLYYFYFYRFLKWQTLDILPPIPIVWPAAFFFPTFYNLECSVSRLSEANDTAYQNRLAARLRSFIVLPHPLRFPSWKAIKRKRKQPREVVPTIRETAAHSTQLRCAASLIELWNEFLSIFIYRTLFV